MNLLYGNKKIEDKLRSQTGVLKIHIATAYISQYGINLLKEVMEKNNLTKNDVELYLRYDFTDKNSYEILRILNETCKVYFIENLHAKVFYLQGEKNLLIYGSANLTYGGLMQNMEFYNIEEDIENLKKCELNLDIFFDKCKEKGRSVNEEMIEAYKEYDEAQREEKSRNSYEKSRKSMNKIKGKKSRVENLEVYKNISNFYFNETDYEVFEEYYEDEDNIEIKERRKKIRNKLLDINSIVKPFCENLEIYNHWHPENITSSISPNQYNHGKVNWLGIRFGRSKSEIDELNEKIDTKVYDENYGFQKYACMQFNISLENFEIGIYHAVANDAVDRSFLREAFEKNTNNIRERVINELKQLKGYGLEWTIWSPYKEDPNINFSIDNDDIESFPDFYLKNDNIGSHSSIMFRFAPNDERLKTKESIANLIMEKFKVLLPLYKIIIWKSKK